MVHIDEQMVNYLTKLSRIQCTGEEQTSLLRDLENILSYIEQLKEVETQDIQPCDHVLEGFSNVMRADEPGETLSRSLFLANAPDQIGGMIRIPTVLKRMERE